LPLAEVDFALLRDIVLARDVRPLVFFAPERVVFPARADLTLRLDADTAERLVFARAFTSRAVRRTVRLTAGLVGLPLSALFPTTPPIIPPTTAPTGPPTAPSTAPAAAPAAVFETGGMSIFLFDSD